MSFLKGYKQSEEHKRKIALANTGKVRTAEAKERCRIANLGKEPWNKGKSNVYSEETKAKMSRARIGKALPAHKAGCKCLRCSKVPWNKGMLGYNKGHRFVKEEVAGEKNIYEDRFIKIIIKNGQ